MAPGGPLNFLANGIVSHNSHAACYALIAYRTAWLRANHPAEYMAALISSVMDTKDKVPYFVARCEEMGIEILPPDVNESDHEFVVVDGNIRFGLDAVKGVGFAAVEKIKAAREEGGRFTSLWDFCERVDSRTVNKRSIEALIKSGAFDATDASRRGMLVVLEAAQGAGQKAQEDAQIGQGSIFDLGGDGLGGGEGAPSRRSPFAPAHPPIPAEEFDRAQLLAVEKEALGLFISEHPLKAVRGALAARVDCSLAELHGRRDGEWVRAGGIVAATKRIRTKKGDPMMFATLDDLEGQVELLVFGNVLSTAESALAADRIVVVRGRVDHKDGATCLIVQEAEEFAPTPEELAAADTQTARRAADRERVLRVRVDAALLPASVIDDLKHLLERFPGDSEVVLEMRTASGDRRLRLGDDYRVAPSVGLRAELDRLLGDATLSAA
jgi:DNA polymerase III subunit alpha